MSGKGHKVPANGVRVVIVEDASRFARELMAQELGITLLISRGVRLLTASGDDLIASDDPTRALIKQVAKLHAERREELAKIIQREMGKPLDQPLGEVEFSAAIYEYYADNAEKFLADEPIDLLGGEGSALIRRSSVGVLIGIMPWNYPYYQVARFAGPNLTLGNTSFSSMRRSAPNRQPRFGKIFTDAGYPEGAYVNVYATNEQIATAIANSRVQGVSLTGSEHAGAAVAEIAGRNLKKVVSARWVGPVHRVELRRPRCHRGGRYRGPLREHRPGLQRGQTLHRRRGHLQLIRRQVHQEGARDRREPSAVVVGRRGRTTRRTGEPGRRQRREPGIRRTAQGCLLPARCAHERLAELPAYREELFGPVATVYKVASEEEAVEVANDTPFGLGSYVFTTDKEQGSRVADRLEAGMVYVNLVGADSAELPFGGVKRSGFGRELGRFGIDEFVNKKLIRTG